VGKGKRSRHLRILRVLLSIPPPPDGYELVSVDGIDIRFRDPAGKILQFIDMVEAGLFGDIDDESE
jgi:hypothetical protein